MIGDCHDMKPLPDSVKKLIEAKTFANIATLMPDGSPHVTQTWIDHDGEPETQERSEESQSRARHLRPRQRLQRGSDPWTRQGGDLQRGRRTCRQAGEKISRTGQVSEPTARYETCIVQDRTPPYRASLHGYYASEIYLRRVDQSYS